MIYLAKEIIDGRRLSRKDQTDVFLTADLQDLCAGANLIREALCGSKADLCSIINGRGGRCSEDCKFCSQSAYHHTNCKTFSFLDEEAFLNGCANASQQGVDRYSIVTAGRGMSGKDMELALAAYRSMHKTFPNMILCASHGMVSQEDMYRLKEAGVSMYHTNVETSERYFPSVCTTHTWQDKLEEIRRAKKAGLEICCGGILGMGETWQDRLDMALVLSEMAITSIPLNFLIPVPGTPFENMPPLETEEILRIVAIFRYFNPTAWIRIAAGRNYFPDGGTALFTAGANAALTGDMLTTVGNNTKQDRAMLRELGFVLR